MKLNDCVSVQSRFSRSINLERDSKASAIEGYLPTGRALDVVRRMAAGLSNPISGRAFSITGPHGTGKSSLAVFLRALVARANSSEHRVAWEILGAADAELGANLRASIKQRGALKQGFVPAFITAGHESVTETVARGLHHGSQRFFGTRASVVPDSFVDKSRAQTLTPQDLYGAVERLASHAPVLLVIDEFGKNLEAYAESSRAADPYLLQELAEWTHGPEGLPLVIITMQHLAFDEYVGEASRTQRREWVKVQGRFEDIPYIETPAQARRLIAGTFSLNPRTAVERAVRIELDKQVDRLVAIGLREIAEDESTRAAYPLNPLALAVLPILCARYGQNERTLFSFLAGTEPLAVPAFLRESTWRSGQRIPFVGLDRIYDYFVDSASTMVSASSTANRWIEIETRIRDTHGLNSAQLRAIKSVGLLNLTSSGGTLRASTSVLDFALTNGEPGTRDSSETLDTLRSLEELGLITFRDFADEYRIWQGSDYDLRTAVDLARRRCRERPLADLLNEASPLAPAVAGRHSQQRGTLRLFERRFSGLSPADLEPQQQRSPWDGTVLYSTVEKPALDLEPSPGSKPVVVAMASNLIELHEAATECAAVLEALRSAEAEGADWVARRELVERATLARYSLSDAIASAWGTRDSRWLMIRPDRQEFDATVGVSSTLSAVCDVTFRQSPLVANEMVAKRELTSQGAKARRLLIEGMVLRTSMERFGIEGYGPQRAMYEAIFRSTGIHSQRGGHDVWTLGRPKDERWAGVWDLIAKGIEEARFRRIGVGEIWSQLAEPPIGLKDGLIPVLLLAAFLSAGDELALYEHGSLVLSLDDAVAERLVKNPNHFSIKNSSTKSGPRQRFVQALANQLGITSPQGIGPTFLQVARAIYRELQTLPAFTQSTRVDLRDEVLQLRQAFREAQEPDELFFETLPSIFGFKAIAARGRADQRTADQLAKSVVRAIRELRGRYADLLDDALSQLTEHTGSPPELDEARQALSGRVADLVGKVVDPKLKAFLVALGRTELDRQEWLENVAMVVADGVPPRTWTDEKAVRYRLNVAELGGALRRVQALLYEHLASGGDEFDAYRVTVTRADGHEQSQVVWIGERERGEVTGVLEGALAEATARLGSVSAARDLLMALLADQRFRTGDEADPVPSKEAERV
jgi:hypothetical protein